MGGFGLSVRRGWGVVRLGIEGWAWGRVDVTRVWGLGRRFWAIGSCACR